MIVDIVDKYLTDDNNPIKNLRLNNFEYSAAIAVFSYVQNRPRNERTDHYQQLKHKEIKWFIYFSKDEQA